MSETLNTTPPALTFMYSPNQPLKQWSMPGRRPKISPPLQSSWISGWYLHVSQVPQGLRPVTILSPTLSGLPVKSFVTFLPSLTISPVPSWPSWTGQNPKGSPLYSCTSVPQMPHPSTFTRISSSPISGIGSS